jgi:hypothetical protein
MVLFDPRHYDEGLVQLLRDLLDPDADRLLRGHYGDEGTPIGLRRSSRVRAGRRISAGARLRAPRALVALPRRRRHPRPRRRSV